MTAPTGERRLGVDPRLQARRQDVLRQQGRRRLRRVQVAAAVVVAGAVGWAGAASPLLDVDRVIVRGLERGRAEDVEAAAGIKPGSPLATVDVERVRSAAESVGWVAAADVSRSWPGSVLISVTERRPVAVVLPADGTTGVLVDADRQLALTGEAMDDKGVVDDEQFEDLPQIIGAVVEAQPGAPLDAAAAGAVELAGLLSREAASGAVPGTAMLQVSLNGQGELDVTLWAGDSDLAARVLFGPAVDLDDKVRTLTALLRSEVLEASTGAVIDVRVASAPVVTLGAP